MPRVRTRATAYKQNDLPVFISHKLVDSKKTKVDLARAIGISKQAFNNRMKKGLFSYSDMVEILYEVGATDEEIIHLMRKDKYK